MQMLHAAVGMRLLYTGAMLRLTAGLLIFDLWHPFGESNAPER